MSFKKRFLFWSALYIACPQAAHIAMAVYTAAIVGFFGLAWIVSYESPAKKAMDAEYRKIENEMYTQQQRDQYQRALKDLERTTNNPQWQSAKEYWMSIGITNRPWIWLPPNPDAPPPKFER